jgi:hypothetical protein
MNDKTIIELGYHKISWFVSVSLSVIIIYKEIKIIWLLTLKNIFFIINNLFLIINPYL